MIPGLNLKKIISLPGFQDYAKLSNVFQIQNFKLMYFGFSTVDFIILALYALVILAVGLWVSRNKKGHLKTTEDYFLASKSLTWWAIGASLIASNISAEQFIGMSGSGYAIGLAIASYEWMAAIALIVVGIFFLPIFLKEKIYTMPQFLERRYDKRVRTILAVFWIFVYVFVNLTSVLYLGALALETITGIPLIYGIIGLALFAAAYSLYGGLSAVAWTDVIQVTLLVLGGLLTTYLALKAIPGADNILEGAKVVYKSAPDHFHMILHKGNPYYKDLPGLSVLIGGMWIANLYYWGFNQYIIQRALAAKSLEEARMGIIFAGFLKILIPLIVVIPGIVAFVLTTNPEFLHQLGPQAAENIPTLAKADRAYPWLMNLLPYGVKGLAFAALTAAIVSSLASMLNSTSTIFTMDIYRHLRKDKKVEQQDENDHHLVIVGRITAAVALIIAIIVAPMLSSLDQVFQYIQEYTGMVSPGILAIFLFGMFWKKTTTKSALWAAALIIPVALVFKIFFKDMPWMRQMEFNFLIISAVIIIVSLIEGKEKDEKAIELSPELFKTSMRFNVGAAIISMIVASLYIIFW